MYIFFNKGKHENIESKSSNGDKAKESDDEGCGMFSSPGFTELAKEHSNKKAGASNNVFVSKPFIITEKNVVKYVVFLGRPEGRGLYPYYIKADHAKYLMEMRTKDLKTPFSPTSDDVSGFENTMMEINLRDSPFSTTSKWLRVGKKKNTQDIITFTITLPLSKKDDIRNKLEYIMVEYFQYVFGKQRKVNTAGQLALNDAQANLPPNADETKGLYWHLVNVKGNGDAKVAADTMTKEINEYWNYNIAYTYDCYLDQFMVDYDIKKWVEENLGANSWDDLNDNCKRVCYKNPGRHMPLWSHIFRESY